MTEVKRYYVGKYGLVEGEALGRLSVVLSSDFDTLQSRLDDTERQRRAEFDAGQAAERLVAELQQRLTAADERLDVLEGLFNRALELLRGTHTGDLFGPDDWAIVDDFLASAALKPAEVKCKTCNGTRIVSDGAMYCSSGGIPFECGPIECVKDCPDCSKP